MKNFKFNVFSIILIWIVGLLPYSPFLQDSYAMSLMSREFTIAILCSCIVVNIPYSHIASKCTMAAFCLTQYLMIAQEILYTYYYWEYSELLVMVSTIAIFIATSILVRQTTQRYKYKSNVIDDTKIYYLCPKADDLNGLLSSMFYFPFSGLKVYCNGNVYAYHHGTLKKFTGRKSLFYMSKCLSFDTNVLYSRDVERELDSLVGKRWSIRHNCYRTFEPLFGDLKDKFT